MSYTNTPTHLIFPRPPNVIVTKNPISSTVFDLSRLNTILIRVARLATTTIRLHKIFPIGLQSRVHFPSLETEDGRFGDAARRGSNAASARCRGAVGGASGSAEDGEEILGVAHDIDNDE